MIRKIMLCVIVVATLTGCQNGKSSNSSVQSASHSQDSLHSFFAKYEKLENRYDPDLQKLYRADAVWEEPAIGHKVKCDGVMTPYSPGVRLHADGTSEEVTAPTLIREELDLQKKDKWKVSYSQVRYDMTGDTATISGFRTVRGGWGKAHQRFVLNLTRENAGDWSVVGRTIQRRC